ncbi:MAG TPA: SGNH/GDSL hydrolase family protein [Nocardioides sp.]|nr:SGNH/GDSL hydrolase family protein [Nocardioides sp.]
MRSWATRGAVLGAVPVLLLAGCTTAKDDADDPDARRNRQPIEAGDHYVALGDSYTSAPGIGQPTGPDGCLRTDGNYPTLLATALELELTDASCGGAKTENVTDEPQTVGSDEVPPQVESVTEDTDLVTLSIGANNGSVYGNLVISCARLAVEDPTGAPCSDLTQQNPDVLPEVFDSVAADIVETVAEILDRAPDARVVIVGYPQIIPAEGTCPLLPLAEGDYPFGRGVLQEFVEAQAKAAEKAGAEYVDVWAATDGHDICADDPWVAGFRAAQAGTPYHPYAEEQAAVADLIESTVAGS